MKSFFDGVKRHIGNMDAEHLREQYRRLSDEVSSLDTLFSTIAQGIIVLDERGEVAKSNPAARELLGMDPEDALPMLAKLCPMSFVARLVSLRIVRSLRLYLVVFKSTRFVMLLMILII